MVSPLVERDSLSHTYEWIDIQKYSSEGGGLDPNWFLYVAWEKIPQLKDGHTDV